ncbi:NAD(P)/FAD-dependent oxidoreductase [Nakamurella alba]|nr:FAD-dependent oxidoreductase [Nakamurella alba]
MAGAGLVVVGSGPAAVAAAGAYRDAQGDGPVRLVTEDPDLPYERPRLSKDVLRGDTPVVDTVLHDPQFYRDRDIELVLSSRVTELRPDSRAVLLADGRAMDFATCVLATGSTPVRPDIPGARHAHVLRSRRDAIDLVDAAERAATAVVVGSGFVGCEAAASLAGRGVAVTLVSHVLPQQRRLGAWVSRRIAEWLHQDGVRLRVGDDVSAIAPDHVLTSAGQRLPADLVLLATGVTPRAELAAAAGLSLSDGRISVSADMRTSHPAVLAAGDVVFARNTAAGRSLTVEHWGDADAMGEVAGRTAAGLTAEWAQPPGFWSTIGSRTLKYTAWGDGYDEVDIDDDGDGFTVRYGRHGELVGVLTHHRDEDYERGQGEVARRSPW